MAERIALPADSAEEVIERLELDSEDAIGRLRRVEITQLARLMARSLSRHTDTLPRLAI